VSSPCLSRSEDSKCDTGPILPEKEKLANATKNVIFPSNFSLLVEKYPHFGREIFDGKIRDPKSGARRPEKRG
jgi:hypothetical protein